MSNALASESSPYLLQHRDNPVDWLPWGEDALARARKQDKPLLVSIGYSACHWCHVMEHESFEDTEVAALMNEHFVCVKVDREERPDIDAIYMEAVQSLTGHGGWPLNVFLTPDQAPFYGGTYFPPQARHGLPAWRDVVYSMARAWSEQRSDIAEISEQLRERLQAATMAEARSANIDTHLSDDAVRNLAASYDHNFGGFGGAPKFPPSNALTFLLAQSVSGSPWAQRAGEMALHTLRQMAAGGIHDQAGGGFARYSVDATWTVPHFEKMLYDNALLLRAYVQGFLVSADPVFAETAAAIADWAIDEMRGPEGGFMSALDADSEGVEGLFYTWPRDELDAALGDLRDDALVWLTPVPFEGRLILEARGDGDALSAEQRAQVRARLLGARSSRVRPATDTKRLTAWNGLMIGALAYAGATLGRPDWTRAAVDAAEFVTETMRDDAGRLLRTSDGAKAKLNGYLEDHAFMAAALLDLYEATFDPRWFATARELCDQMIERFADVDNGGFFATSADHEKLLVRRKELEDNPIPSGSSSAALTLLRMAALTGDAGYERHADSALAPIAAIAPRYAAGFGHALLAIDFRARPVTEVALAGDDISELAGVVRAALRPGIVLAGPPGHGVPLMQSRTPINGAAAAYVCERFVCQAPVTDPADLERLLRRQN